MTVDVSSGQLIRRTRLENEYPAIVAYRSTAAQSTSYHWEVQGSHRDTHTKDFA